MPNIEQYNWLSNKQVLFVIAFAISATFTLTMIYSEFRSLQERTDVLEHRLDSKTKRLELDNKNIWKMINEMKNK